MASAATGVGGDRVSANAEHAAAANAMASSGLAASRRPERRGFSHTQLATTIGESGCKNPLHCVLTLRTAILQKVQHVKGLCDGLIQCGFFEKMEETSGGRQCREEAELDTKTDHDKIRTILGQVEKKTNRIPIEDKKRYTSDSPLVSFIYSLAQVELEIAEDVRNCIIAPHDCKEHHEAQFLSQTSEAGETTSPVSVREEAPRSHVYSADELLGLDECQQQKLVLATMDDLHFSHQKDSIDAKQISRYLQGLDVDNGACNSPILKIVKKVLKTLMLEKQVRDTGEKHRNLPCFELCRETSCTSNL